jgi:hypothetical protein
MRHGEPGSEIRPNRAIQATEVNEPVDNDDMLATLPALLIKSACLRCRDRGEEREVVSVPDPVCLNAETLRDVKSCEDVQCRTVCRLVQRYRGINVGRIGRASADSVDTPNKAPAKCEVRPGPPPKHSSALSHPRTQDIEGGSASTEAQTTAIESYAPGYTRPYVTPPDTCHLRRACPSGMSWSAVREKITRRDPTFSEGSRRARPGLRRGPAGWEQRTQEKVIFRILNPIPVFVHPPSSAEITRLAGAELGLAVRQEVEPPLHRQRILDNERA